MCCCCETTVDAAADAGHVHPELETTLQRAEKRRDKEILVRLGAEAGKQNVAKNGTRLR